MEDALKEASCSKSFQTSKDFALNYNDTVNLMILTLRLISQICQCFEDRGIDEAESEKNGLPLYLR